MSIKKIAEMTGASCATVSRVLNNPDYKCANPQLRDRIWQAAMSLNYVPNEAARSLKLGTQGTKEKTYYINVLMTRMDAAQSDPFFTELLRVIESEIHKAGCILSEVWYRSLFSDDKRCRRENVDAVIEKLYESAEGRCDGLIIIGRCNHEALGKLKRRYKSVVCVNRDTATKEADEVICNGRNIAKLAVEYLIELGHESIGYVGGCQNEARYLGYLETLEKHGLDIDSSSIIATRQTEAEGYEAMARFMESGKCPTGIYCSNDITAIGMLKYLNKHKSRYFTPSIISSDGIEEAQYTTPMLTTVQIPREEMGRFALYLILDRLKGGHEGTVRMELDCHLVKRSSAIPAGETRWCDYYI